MSYKALYRKYRPETFEDVTDQQHIVKTLKNAVSTDRISHAYMFSGPRGTGKTSIAKIFAKAVNCRHTNNGEPCNYCDVCKSYQDGSNPDVIEIDAASNNGVEYIRELRENSKFMPAMSKYKVYIIDEVHMLSNSAFNALLKILEEPPKHIIFILCTTDPQKVIPTVQSRCQRFDFHLISTEGIINRLKYVTKEENIRISDEAIEIIAETAEGGMRDALSLLDQIVAYSQGDSISVDDCLEVSGRLSTELLTQIVKSIYNYDSSSAINLLSSLLKIGKEVERILSNLLSFYKDILMIKNLNYKFVKVGYDKKDFIDLVNMLSNQKIYKYIDILTEAQSDMRFSSNKRLYLELAFIKMSDKAEFKDLLLNDSDSLPKGYNPNINYSNLASNQFSNIPKSEPVKENRIVNPTPIVPKKEVIEPVKEVPTPIVQEKVIEEEKPVQIEEPVKEDKPIVEEPKIEAIVSEPQEIKNNESNNQVSFGFENEKEEKEEPQASEPNDEITYDIHEIEEILNNNVKSLRIEIFGKLGELLDKYSNHPKYSNYIGLLEDVKFVACSKDAILLQYIDVSFCNLLMKDENYNAIKDLFKEFYGIDFKLVTVPLDLFKIFYDEFSAKFKQNLAYGVKKYINLTYVAYPELKTIKKEEKNDDNEFQELDSLFSDFDGFIKEK